MSEFWVLVEENYGGLPVLRKVATTENEMLAEDIYRAILDTGNYEKVFLAEIKEQFPRRRG